MSFLVSCSGTYGEDTGLVHISQCIDVQPGFYAPTGSSQPIPCPSWGLCAGRAYDTQNTVPGSQPVGVSGGSQVMQQTQTVVDEQDIVEQTIELLASDSGAVNETAFLHHVASVYGVPVEAISLTLTREEQALKEWEDALEDEGEGLGRRQLEAGRQHSSGHVPNAETLAWAPHTRALQTSGKKLTYSLRIDPSYVISLSASAASRNATALSASMQAAAAGLTTSLAAALGLNVTLAAAPAVSTRLSNRTLVVNLEVACPPGHWGSDGKCIACSPGRFDVGGKTTACTDCRSGTYQPDRGASACQVCETGSYCIAGSSIAAGCPAGRYSNLTGLGAAAQCMICPAGSVCAVVGSVVPVNCAPGSFTSEMGRSSCTGCEPGRNQPARGQTGCGICPSRTFSSFIGAVECNNCLSHLSSYPGSIECGICDEGFFRRDSRTKATPEACEPCFEKGARCLVDATLETMVVLPGFWRLSNRSRVITKCKGGAVEQRCIGGTDAGASGEGYCGKHYTGPECLLCRGGRGLYRKKGECIDCPEVGGKIAVLAGLAVAIAALVVAFYLALFHRLGGRVAALKPTRRMVAWVHSYVIILGLPAKLKILFSFYGIITVLDTTYDARMPQSYTNAIDAVLFWAETDQWFSSLVLPSECTPFASSGSSFRSWLLVKALTPLFVVLIVMLGSIAVKCARLGCSRQSLVAGVFSTMPLTLVISFLFVPGVSMSIFQSFLCVEYQFDASDAETVSMHSYLHSDLRVRCSEGGYNGAEHNLIKRIAVTFIAIWPVGMVALYAIVLMPARASLLARSQTALVRGTRFLHKDYRVECFYWELVELVRRTFLIGWVLFIFSTEQTFLRLVVALLVSVVSLVLLLSIRPYRRSEDNLLAAGCQLVLVLSFIGALLIRLFEEFSLGYSTVVVQRVMVFRSASAIAIPLLFLTMMMSILMLLIMAVIIRKEGNQPTIRLESSGAPPEMTLLPWQRWHLFLSHTWASAQEYLP